MKLFYTYLKKRKLLFLSLFITVFISSLFVLDNVFPLETDVSYSQLVLDRNGVVLHAFLSKDDKWRMYTELDEISEDLQKAIIHKEDKYFYYHFGVNPLAITRALIHNLLQQRRTSGASTITMQVARLLEPKKRTYFNKIIEMYRAIQLEWYYSKEEILQMYLNLVPYGGNIEGVKSASLLYFNKMPNHLSLAEITALSIIPNRPSSLRLGEDNEYIIQERNKWLETFKTNAVFDESIIQDALEEPLTAQRMYAPKEAPHFSYRMKYQFQNQPIIRTTLDWEKQKKAEQVVESYMKSIHGQHIHNCAVLAIDNHTMQAIAYIGSADFHSTEDAGQVDGVRAVRQPGSTLKPLVYGLSFDQGLYNPKTIIPDVPVNFDGYRPVNFNKEYNGYISIEYALAQSLNVPAVKVLDEIGVDQVIEKLISANFNTIQDQKDWLGLSLVLGGCGVRLEELTSLYSAYAHQGFYRPIQWTTSDNHYDSISILSPASAFMISEILTQLERPDLPLAWENSKNLPRIAWKTGTSYGRKDAWSIGYNEDYTIGVWVGNFSGVGVPELTGASKATPLLFKLFESIDAEKDKAWLSAPEELKFRLVCSESGYIPSDQCENVVFDYFIPLVSSSTECSHLKKTYTTENDSMSYCLHCLPESGYKEKWIHNHPPEMIAYFNRYGIAYDKVPAHNPLCEQIYTKHPPKIISPIENTEYLISKNNPEELMLRAYANHDAKEVYWYIDDQFYNKALKDEAIYFTPESGTIKISCSDDLGRNTDIEIDVRYIDY